MKHRKTILNALLPALALVLWGCGSVNSNGDPHFDEDGHFLGDSTTAEFRMECPREVSFYVEVSGSMNGFFRANQPTDFKADLWNVLTYYRPLSRGVNVLTNDGDRGASLSHSEFQTLMNTGSFVSSASTQVPLMLRTIIGNLMSDSTQVAVLVSDMKYSPVGSSAPEVLMTQYSSDVSAVLARYGKAVSLICATSNYLDSKGQDIAARSPYYFLVIGRPEYVAYMRNGISTLIESRGHFVDNIDSGFDFGHPRHTFGVSEGCYQLDDEPTFLGYEEADGDTCTINLKVALEDYRWIMACDSVFGHAFKARTIHGSGVKVGRIEIKADNITGKDHQIDRKATVTVALQLFDMATDSEVIEWRLELPDTNCALFGEFFENATDENDPTKSYSVEDFIRGMFHGGVVNRQTEPNYILVSKHD